MSADFDTGPLRALAAEMEAEGFRVGREARQIVHESSMELRDDWRDNIRESAGAHGKHAPKSIKSEMRMGGLGADIGPDEGMAQGGMAWEFGSQNQPPHLDGQRALDVNRPKIIRRVESLGFLE